LVAAGLPGRQPDRKEEKKGPRVGAPEKAVEGFLTSVVDLGVEPDVFESIIKLDVGQSAQIGDVTVSVVPDKKAPFFLAAADKKGRDTAKVIAGFMPEIVRAFPWPKSMRWGDGDLRWVRPLKSILCCFDGEVVDFEIDGIKSGDVSRGHRFLAPKEFRARTFEKYEEGLRAGKVILDRAARAELIAREAKTLCEAQGLELVEDKGLLAEVAGLSEWPVPMMGAFDEKFLAVPDEVLTASMRGHQKYFSVRDPKTGRLANRFVYVANIEAPDAGKAMREGYERVLTARLSDAWYLYHQDLKTPLGERVAELDRITFFEGLGSVGGKAKRVAALAKEIAPAVGADPALAEKAALLAKADLVTQMVREFPELQGVMGRYYALAQGEAPEIADAIRDHYKPQGADDDVPAAPVSVAVALADKIDTLAAFWAIGKKPTGSSDPFALRRAALGGIELQLLRLLTSLKLRLRLRNQIYAVLESNWLGDVEAGIARAYAIPQTIISRNELKNRADQVWFDAVFDDRKRDELFRDTIEKLEDLLEFIRDRLKVYLREKGHRYDHVEAVLYTVHGDQEDDLVLIVRKLEALEAFLKTDDGANLAAGFKRAANILKAEGKKGAVPGSGAISEKALALAEEKALYAALLAAEEKAKKAVAAEKFEDAMTALALLRKPIDAFFDKVTVNADDPALRGNRLALLARFRAATAEVADLSKLEG
ncbi:MAG: glycine--tRNA ligase subunit beta, partial [Amphiplicatus sp.]